jgi:hypothetical protein
MTASPPLTQFMPSHLPDASKCHPPFSSQGQKATPDRGKKGRKVLLHVDRMNSIYPPQKYSESVVAKEGKEKVVDVQ